nr:uncharacterized protein LOC112543837 [Pelodiscus sinensis]|eukprot:XP_025034680.1 uncharacterized protein LOC112543837 [Pelodiscus sinensis]
MQRTVSSFLPPHPPEQRAAPLLQNSTGWFQKASREETARQISGFQSNVCRTLLGPSLWKSLIEFPEGREMSEWVLEGSAAPLSISDPVHSALAIGSRQPSSLLMHKGSFPSENREFTQGLLVQTGMLDRLQGRLLQSRRGWMLSLAVTHPSTAKSRVATSEGKEAVPRGPHPEDEIVDEEVEEDEDQGLPPRSPIVSGSQELFSTADRHSRSEEPLSRDQEAGDDTQELKE